MPKQNKMMQLVNCRLRLTLQDGRVMVGQLLAFDKHMNLVIADCEEFRRSKQAKSAGAGGKKGGAEQRRTLGLIMLRGQHIISMCPEGAPPPVDANKIRTPASLQMGPGMGRGTGRGVPMPPPGAPPAGLSGPVPGMYSAPPPPGVPVGYGAAPTMPFPPHHQ